jgi:hypothetical protein
MIESLKEKFERIEKQNKKPYIKWIKDELKKYNVRVHRWGEFIDDEIFYAYFDSRRVYIPIPECDYSFTLALHEIGHILLGNNKYGHIAEYNAEIWCLELAKEKYNIYDEEYELTAKEYVYEEILKDIIYQCLPPTKINPQILKWLETNPKTIKSDAQDFYLKVKDELRKPHRQNIEFLLFLT